jgi:hypothetical protein
VRKLPEYFLLQAASGALYCLSDNIAGPHEPDPLTLNRGMDRISVCFLDPYFKQHAKIKYYKLK